MLNEYLENFVSLEQEVRALLDASQVANASSSSTTQTADAGGITAETRAILQRRLRDMKRGMAGMEWALHSLPPQEKLKNLPARDRCRQVLAELQRQVLTLSQQTSERSAAEQCLSDAEKRRLLALEKLERSNRTLKEARNLAVEANAIGAGTLVDLHAQRETVQRAHVRIDETKTALDSGDSILSRMSQWWRSLV